MNDVPAQQPTSSADGVAWDLSDLYAGPDDPALQADMEQGRERALEFAAKWRGRLAGLDIAGWQEALRDLETLEARLQRPLIYASLRFAADTATPANNALYQQAQQRYSEADREALFFMLEWQALDDERVQALMAAPELSTYRQMLQRGRQYIPHTLSEAEERIMSARDLTGKQAFQRLFGEITSALTCTIEDTTGGGGNTTLSLEQTLSMLHHPGRETRRAAAGAISAALATQERVVTTLYNTLVQDHAEEDNLRRYENPMSSRNLANEITQPQVDALLDACDAGNPLVARYYTLKQGLLGLDRLVDYDRYAPIFDDLPSRSYAEGREIVLEAYGAFSPEMADVARLFFERNWIDAALRPGKRGGAFSASTLPDAHPYVLLNYTDQMNDVMTMAHELGHGVHQYLARGQGLFAQDTPLTTAETASVFGEMLTFQSLMAAEPSARVRLALLCAKLESIFATVFRQAAMTRFEQRVHAARRTQGALDAPAIGAIWMETNQAMFGDSVELTPEYAAWWQYIPHFINTPFYCYAYSFGELLVLALHGRYLEEGAAFVPKYLDLLRTGGSMPPAELLRPMGLEIEDPGFWALGVAQVEAMVAQAEQLAREVAA